MTCFTQLGFIGLGTMGHAMVERLLDVGHSLTVWNRTAERCGSAVSRGAVPAGSIAEVARTCEIAAVCLSDGAAVESIATGQGGLLDESNPRLKCIVDFSTIDPALSAALSEHARKMGVVWIDCPVSGGPLAARAGSLIGFAGTTQQGLTFARPMTDGLFARVTPMGAPGTGQVAKLCNQWIVASNLLVVAEALAAARKLGMDVSRLPEALAGGFADSKPLQVFGHRMAAHNFEPHMGAIRLMRKDVRLAFTEGARHGALLPMLSCVSQLYDSVVERADMSLDDDISSLIRLFEPSPPAADSHEPRA